MITDEYKSKVMKGKSHWLERESDVERFVEALRKEKGEIDGLMVLDAGCAQGRDSVEILENGLKVVGVDIDENFIKEARENNSEIQFDVGKIEELSYENGEFDAVYCINTLFYTKSEESLPELERVLKPGGIAFVTIDEKIIDLEKDEEIYKQDIEEALKQFKSCEVLSDVYREREDKNPFRHRHFFHEVVLRKQGV